MKNSLSSKKINLFKTYKNYFSKRSKQLDVAKSPFTYPCTWHANTGYYNLRSLYIENRFLYIKNKFLIFFQYMKELIGNAKLHHFYLEEPKIPKGYVSKNLYITWFKTKDFDSNLKFKDNYIPSFTSKNNIWFLINADTIQFKNNTKKNNEKFYIFQKSFTKTYNFIFFLKIILKVIFENKFSLIKIIHELNTDAIFAKIIVEKILLVIKKNNIKKVFLPYEGQPFQKHLVKTIKRKLKKVKIYGFINAIQPFPIHLFEKNNIPHKNYSASPSQINQLVNIFNWDKKRISLVKSFRFKKNNVSKYKNKILLPFNINNKKEIYRNIKMLIESKPKNYFSRLKIVPHPIGVLNSRYQNFVKDLEILLESFDYKFSKKVSKKFSLVVGSTSTVLEALEFKLKVYHIVDQNILEALDDYFWPIVKVNKINEHTYDYKINKYKKLIFY